MKKQTRVYFLHAGLFLLTLITTTMVGAEFVLGKSWYLTFFGDFLDLKEPELIQQVAAAQFQWHEVWSGLTYSIAFLAFLSFHEFGHYFTSIYHNVRCSLPYYIPIYIPLPVLNIGSLGAVIRLRQIPESTRKYFDIGIAGPLAGFVVSLFLLIYGFSTLPDLNEYVLQIHPEYEAQFGGVPTEAEMRAFLAEAEREPAYYIGTSLLFQFLMDVIPSDPAQVPSPFELMHYPFLFVGYITLFFTALNLLPIGQLDGGHIIYGMFGQRVSGYVARVSVVLLLLVGGTGLVDVWGSEPPLLSMGLYLAFLVYVFGIILPMPQLSKVLAAAGTLFVLQMLIRLWMPELQPNLIWLIYAFMVVRFIGVDHPPAAYEHRVNRGRQLLGWLAILIFILCFTPQPILLVGGTP